MLDEIHHHLDASLPQRLHPSLHPGFVGVLRQQLLLPAPEHAGQCRSVPARTRLLHRTFELVEIGVDRAGRAEFEDVVAEPEYG